MRYKHKFMIYTVLQNLNYISDTKQNRIQNNRINILLFDICYYIHLKRVYRNTNSVSWVSVVIFMCYL